MREGDDVVRGSGGRKEEEEEEREREREKAGKGREERRGEKKLNPTGRLRN